MAERLDLLMKHHDTVHRQIARLRLAPAATGYKITTCTEGPAR